jgi:cyclophilin family peptidyl-prolyl cis-trans isomerase
MRLFSFPLLLLAFFLIACGGGDDDDNGGSSGSLSCGPSSSRIASIQRTGEHRYSAPPERVIDPAKSYVARMKTERGDIVLQLAAADAPNTVNNFVFLSCAGYYDGLIFHRVVKQPQPFVIQGGDPLGNGRGGPGYMFGDEFSPRQRHDAPGVLSMANAGPGTNGSQFFITLAPTPHLDNMHSVFGRVTEGMNVVNAIQAGDEITSISVEER